MATLPKKPSQLLLDGIKKSGGIQITGDLYDGTGYCALGAIYAGYGLSNEAIEQGEGTTTARNQLFDGWQTYYPLTQLRTEGYDGYVPDGKDEVDQVIIFLNDTAGWPFWRISNWLRDSLGL